MTDTIKIDQSAIEIEKHTVISVYKKQLEAFRYLKKEIERVQWADSRYDELIEQLNIIGKTLSDTLQSITNGDDVYVISDLIPLANEYSEYAKKFPKI